MTAAHLLTSRSPAETEAFGELIGGEADPGTVLLLDGTLGVGKTVLARGIARGLAVAEWRGSPTFNLVHEYPGRLPFFHIDAYRLTLEELLDLDLDWMITAKGVFVIEWGGQAEEHVLAFDPKALFRIRMVDAGDSLRQIEVVAVKSSAELGAGGP